MSSGSLANADKWKDGEKFWLYDTDCQRLATVCVLVQISRRHHVFEVEFVVAIVAWCHREFIHVGSLFETQNETTKNILIIKKNTEGTLFSIIN